jgi:activator of HSP90 ATPase
LLSTNNPLPLSKFHEQEIGMKTYQKYFKIKAKPDEIYNALVKPFAIELWSGDKAIMEEKENTLFSLFDGDITGLNLEFIPDKKIIQEWFFGDQEERSIVSITLHAAGSSTKIKLNHTNIPDDAFDEIKYGWEHYYFGGLRDFFQH